MKKSKSDRRVYLEDIIAAIERIRKYTTEGKEHFIVDILTQDAVLRQFMIIGEAASKLPAAVRTAHKDIPWKLIIGLRNVIIHDYSEITIARIWEAVELDLPVLKRAVTTMLSELPKKEE